LFNDWIIFHDVFCLSEPFSNLADWLGVGEIGLYNFKPSVRPVPLEVHIQVREVILYYFLAQKSYEGLNFEDSFLM